jgi:hypothetical protein
MYANDLKEPMKPSRLLHLAAAGMLAAGMWGAFALPAGAADKQPVPDSSATATEQTFESVRGVQYCEIWLIAGTPKTGLGANYYNTTALNNTDPMDTCPPDMWAKVDAKALEAEYNVASVFKNGPRGWTMDSFQLPAGPVRTLDGLKTRWLGVADLPKGVNLHEAGAGSYRPLQSHRKSSMTFRKGKPVFILEDAEGTPWVMQAFSKIVDPTLTYDTLAKLGDKLKPAPGWKFRVTVLEQDLTISAPQGYNWIVQDEIGNTYDACKDGACNFRP